MTEEERMTAVVEVATAVHNDFIDRVASKMQEVVDFVIDNRIPTEYGNLEWHRNLTDDQVKKFREKEEK